MTTDLAPEPSREDLERELRLHRELMAASGAGVYRIDLSPPIPVTLPVEAQIERLLDGGRIGAANDAMAAMYGYRAGSELVGRGIGELLLADDPTTRASLHAFVDGGHRYQDVESVEVDRDGHRRHFLNSAVGMIEEGGLVAVWGTQRDLTAERRMLERLRQSERRFELAFRVNPAALSISTLAEGRFLDVNQAFATLIGMPQAELIGRTGPELRLWDSAEERGRLVAAIQRDGFVLRQPARVRRVTGELRRALISGMPMDLDGEPCLLTLAEDVTETERIADALRRSEERFRAAVDGSLDAFFVLEAVRDGGGRVEDFIFADLNSRGEEFLGRERAAVLGRRLRDLLPGDRRRGLVERYGGVLDRGQVIEEEFDIAPPGRPPRWLHHQVVPLADGVAIWTRDVTERHGAEEERRRLERQMQDAQRLEALGQLAGGVAHDFNNLLTGIQGYAELAARRVEPGSPAAPLLGEILVGARRAAELTQKMLAFAGGAQLQIEWVGLNEIVTEMAELARVAMPAGRGLVLDLARPGPGCEGDATQIRQVAMNLLLNASEAIESGVGAIVVTTGECWCDRVRLDLAVLGRERPEGRYAFLAVRDEGAGMSDEVRSRIFDPFFSTKFTGRGLGLAAVLGIVRAHLGAIEIESRPGAGSVFTVLLPLAIVLPRSPVS